MLISSSKVIFCTASFSSYLPRGPLFVSFTIQGFCNNGGDFTVSCHARWVVDDAQLAAKFYVPHRLTMVGVCNFRFWRAGNILADHKPSKYQSGDGQPAEKPEK